MSLSNLTDEQVLERYSNLAEVLQESLAGLADRQLALRRGPDFWNIRQIVHHIIDSDFLAQNIILAALGNSGCRYDQTWYQTDNAWAEILCYEQRLIEPSLDMFRANHKNVITLIKLIPDALDRYVEIRIDKNPEWKKVPVRYLLLGRISHSEHHIGQIQETRKKNNL